MKGGIKVAAVIVLLALGTSAGAATSPRLPGAPKCPLFPASNVWNKRVDKLPVAANSQRVISYDRARHRLHPDFGTVWDGHPNGIPYTIASKKTKRYRVNFEYASESDKGPYPIPAKVKIEGGSDHHALIVDRDRCRSTSSTRCRSNPVGLERRLGRDLEPALEQAAAGELDLGRRRRAADPARPRPLRRGRPRPDRPRAPLHGREHAQCLHLSGAPLRQRPDRSQPAADGPARAAARRLRHQRLSAPGARHPRRRSSATG